MAWFLWCALLTLMGIAVITLAIIAVWTSGPTQSHVGGTAAVLGITWFVLGLVTFIAEA